MLLGFEHWLGFTGYGALQHHDYLDNARHIQITGMDIDCVHFLSVWTPAYSLFTLVILHATVAQKNDFLETRSLLSLPLIISLRQSPARFSPASFTRNFVSQQGCEAREDTAERAWFVFDHDFLSVKFLFSSHP